MSDDRELLQAAMEDMEHAITYVPEAIAARFDRSLLAIRAALSRPAAARAPTAAGQVWVSTGERMPAQCETSSGYFWCWAPAYDAPEILELYGYADQNAPGTGFCHEAGGVAHGITHWQPATPPAAPK